MLTEPEPIAATEDEHSPSLADINGPRRRGRGRPVLVDEANPDRIKPGRPSRDGTMPYRRAMIVWTPLSEIGDAGEFRSTAGQVAVLPLDAADDRCYAYACHAGCIDDPGMPLSRTQAQAAMLELFNRLSLQGIKPRRIHEAFLAVMDYRRALHISIPGASRPPGYAAKVNRTDREP